MVIKGIEGLLASKRANYAQYVLYGEETPPIDLEQTNKQTKNVQTKNIFKSLNVQDSTLARNALKQASNLRVVEGNVIDLRTQSLK